VAGRTPALKGIRTIYNAFVRVDKVHTSFVAGVAWMDPTLSAPASLGFVSSRWLLPDQYSAPISAAASKTLVAAFNAGFRMQDAEGGDDTDGKTIIALANGAASVAMPDKAWHHDHWVSGAATSS
jgi:hypothetical protein